MIKNKTKLQTKILNAISGHQMQEIIHAFEIIKLDIILHSEDYALKMRA